MGKNPFFGDEFDVEETPSGSSPVQSESGNTGEQVNNANGGSSVPGGRLPRKGLPGTRRTVVLPGAANTPTRVTPTPSVQTPSRGVPSVPSSGSPSSVRESDVQGSNVPQKRERPQVVLPPSSGAVRKPFLSDQEREKLGPRPNKGVVLPPSDRRAQVDEDVFDDVFSTEVGSGVSSLPSSGEGSVPPRVRVGEEDVLSSGGTGEGGSSSSRGLPLPGRGKRSGALTSSSRVESVPSSVPSSGRGKIEWDEVDEVDTRDGESVSVSSAVESPASVVRKVRAPKAAPTPRAQGLASIDDNWDEVEDEVDEEPSYRESVLEASSNKGVRIMDRDIEIFNFLGRYRYAQDVQIARLVKTSDKAAYIRLSKLADAGLIKRHEIARGHTVWAPLKGAMAIAELDFPVVSASRISLSMMGHELGLANLGVELETGQDNVLKEEGWPFYNKYAAEGDIYNDEMRVGENVFTTREIRSAQTRWNAGKSSAQMVAERDELLRLWSPGERSPETLTENAGMFVLYSNDYKDHIPDMIVARDRNADGTPNSIAIELELNPKPLEEWRRILKNYRDYINNGMLHSLYYFTQRKAINDTLRKLNTNEIGIPEERFKILRYTPRNGKQMIFG